MPDPSTWKSKYTQGDVTLASTLGFLFLNFVCGFISSAFSPNFCMSQKKMLFLVRKIWDLWYFGLTLRKIQLSCFDLRFWCWDINVEHVPVGLIFLWIWWNLARYIKSLSSSLLYCTVNYISLQNESSHLIFFLCISLCCPSYEWADWLPHGHFYWLL